MDAIVITLLPELMALMDSSWKISSEKSNFKVVVESRSSGAFLEFPSDEKIICTYHDAFPRGRNGKLRGFKKNNERIQII